MSAKRQVIVIMTDTQRWDMVGCYGNPDMKTPRLDALADQGLRFNRAYTCQPVCGPARSALFTGLFPHSCNGWANSMAIGNNVKTVGQRLNDHNIHCGYVGKWHLDGSDYFGLGECAEGWDPDYWYEMKNYLDELTPEERVASREASTNNQGIDRSFTYGNRCSNRAIDFLNKHGDEDFLLVVSYDEPHHPFLCPEPYASMHEETCFPIGPQHHDDLANKPEHHQVWAEGRNKHDKSNLKVTNKWFFGCNSFVDDEIGRVIDAIDANSPDALVIYTSDHGDFLQGHSLNGKGPATYDDIARIPFIVRWPGQAPAGLAPEHPTSHIDIVPTILDVFNVPQPKVIEGKSMVESLKDPSKATNNSIFVEFGRYEIDHDGFGGFQPLRCAFDGRYKLTINLLTSDELYDMETDPGEVNNLIEDSAHTSIRDGLHDQILNWMNDTRDPFRGYYWERRPWRSDAVESSWDYTGYTRQRENEEYEPRQLVYETGLVMEEATRLKNAKKSVN